MIPIEEDKPVAGPAINYGSFRLEKLLGHHMSKPSSIFIRDSRGISDDLHRLVFGNCTDHEQSIYNLFAHVAKILLLEVPSSMLEEVLINTSRFSYYNCFTMSEPSIEALASKMRRLVKAEERSDVLAAGLDIFQEAGKFAYKYQISIDDMFDWE